MLGADPGTSFAEAVVSLHPGDVLVLYSDGLIVRRDRDLDAGFAALLEAAEDLAGRSADEACAALIDRLAPAAGYEDDVCLLTFQLPT